MYGVRTHVGVAIGIRLFDSLGLAEAVPNEDDMHAAIGTCTIVKGYLPSDFLMNDGI